MEPDYEVVVMGDGPAGATTALYTTRLGHGTAVIDRGGGRHTAVRHVHNYMGVSEDVSGKVLNGQAREQLATYGADYYTDDVRTITGEEGDFRIHCEHHDLTAERVVLATGFRDVPADVRGLTHYTGRGLFYCLHCDAYRVIDEPVYVLGRDDHAATVAMIMCNFTADVDFLLNGDEPAWSDETERRLDAHPIEIVETEVVEPYPDESGSEEWLGGLRFADGTERAYTGGFAMYGSRYNAELAADLGCERADDGSIVVDADGRTSVAGVYAVGDVIHGQNQTAVAVGNGARAGIALHKELRVFPLSIEEIEAGERADAPSVPENIRERAAAVRAAETHPGLVPREWE
jgi:thioredoxin reductase (NADPH)